MNPLRVAWPPLADLTLDSPLDYAWLDRQGQVTSAGQSTLSGLGQRGKTPAISFFLHPRDSLLASIDLPNLSASKTTAAVQCAAQALIRGDCEQMYIAHSPRDEQGRVHIAWLSRQWLAHFGQLVRLAGLNVRGVHPAAYCLPVSEGAVACVWGGQLLVRYSVQQAAVHPAPEEALSDLLLESAGSLQWIGEGMDNDAISRLPDARRWSGPLPGWGLHGGMGRQGIRGTGWGRAAACCALAIAVWTVGLNLYAAREAGVGQQLKAQMNLRVKQAFPELPVILNPLQQARQQLKARQEGSATDPTRRFAHLLNQAGSAMPFIAGSVQGLAFDSSELHLSLIADARRAPSDPQWQTMLAGAGVDVSPSDDGWFLRPAAEPATRNADTSGEADDE